MLNKKAKSDPINVLSRGGVIITPSESCYGLSCDVFNQKAVARINQIKGDRAGMPLSVVVGDLEVIGQIGLLNNTAIKLSNAFHPGQLNLIVDFKEPQKYGYLSSNGIAFRIPANKILFDLVKEYGQPITSSSANLHGEKPLYKIAEVKSIFGNKVDYILDAGDLDPLISPSTVYDTRSNILIREGPINLDQIRSVLES